MSTITDLMTVPCTIGRRTLTGARDDLGNPEATITQTAALCELQKAGGSEGTEHGTIAPTTYDLILPPSADIAVGDSVTAGGITYQVHGVPWEARNPATGAVEHIEATLVVTKGAEAQEATP